MLVSSLQPRSATRLDYLDNLRSFALLLGLTFHVAIVYAAEIKYPLRNVDRTWIFDVFGEWVHLFRMPLFFFLSGYFSERTFRSKGLFDFIRLRGFRIIIPLISGIILFAPMQYYIAALIDGYQENYFVFLWNEFLLNNPRPSHLWFLQYLVLYTFLYVAIRPILSKIGQYLFPYSRYGDAEIEPFSRKRWEVLLILGIWSTFWTCLVNYFFLKDSTYFTVEPVQFVYDITFFAAGGFFLNKEKTILMGETTGKEILLLGFFALLAFNGFYWIKGIDPFWSYFGYTGDWRRILHIFLKCLGGWLWVSFFIRLFQFFFSGKNSFSEYLRDSSLPVYLVHHPVALGIGFIIVQKPWSVWMKFPLHLLSTYFLTFAIYHFLIRNSHFLNSLLGNAKNISPPKIS
ncbi:acyltransferase [Leptospira broomii serovar Hurstbridge str. 5399]|uniref:Acyltransferase n=1 Tax=Leptospira broomii serovar Hurstbridge str. 5399 TaxID=1049789 RepID=T0F0T4_9LEPT|nr:acyltransferase family protein [Leptospira broomii]EQA44765.1 acyltransferase [Leptospira broomii serovar Hurstbridge str. 5399]